MKENSQNISKYDDNQYEEFFLKQNNGFIL